MAYELRVPGQAPVVFETETDAMAAARSCVTANPDAVPEVIDLATGKSSAPGATAADREAMRQRVGF